jgi:hypothetical protein
MVSRRCRVAIMPGKINGRSPLTGSNGGELLSIKFGFDRLRLLNLTIFLVGIACSAYVLLLTFSSRFANIEFAFYLLRG